MEEGIKGTDSQREAVEKGVGHGQEEEAPSKPQIVVVKTSIGHEKIVADAIAGRVKRRGAKVFSILSPSNLRGYLLVETLDKDEFKNLVKGIPRVRGMVEGSTIMGEISHFLTPKPLVSGIVEGDIVELVSGPFKGEKARVQQIDEAKEEITVELFEALISIPVTVKGDCVRVIEKEEEEK
ncbi:MAG: transcription elongation factor Spt5 [Thermoplasmata archaeon]